MENDQPPSDTGREEVAPEGVTFQLLRSYSHPDLWIVRRLADETYWLVPASFGGWDKRIVFRGDVSRLFPARGHFILGVGVPLVRDWKAIMRDRNGFN